ncbi:unnamed protein product, partial [Mesorhabditis spiculigera]
MKTSPPRRLRFQLVPSCSRAISIPCPCLMLKPRKYAEVKVTFNPELSERDWRTHHLSVYARAVHPYNVGKLRMWLKGSAVSRRQLVTQLALSLESIRFSAQEVIVDLPGGAQMWESVTRATPAIDDSDTFTCLPIDGDTQTAVVPAAEELEQAKRTVLEREPCCWLLGPLLDMLFPPLEPGRGASQMDFQPCAGYASRQPEEEPRDQQA